MTEPLTPERLSDVDDALLRATQLWHPRHGGTDDLAAERAFADRTILAAKVKRLRAENARAMQCFDRDQKVIADLQAERGRLQAQVAAVEALAKKWDEADRVGQHRWGALEPSADALRAALASGDEVQSCGNCDCQFGCEGVEVQP